MKLECPLGKKNSSLEVAPSFPGFLDDIREKTKSSRQDSSSGLASYNYTT